MKNIEERLREAYRGAAETVAPDGIPRLDEQSVTISSVSSGTLGRSHRRLMIPFAAAAAVAMVGVLTAVIIPQVLAGSRSGHTQGPPAGRDHHNSSPPAGGSPAGRFVVEMSDPNGQALTVRNASSGVSVAAIAPPTAGLGFAGLATGDGRTYVAMLWKPGVCETWLDHFRLDGAGRPSRLVPFAIARVHKTMTWIAVSRDNSTFAYYAQKCTHAKGPVPSDLGAVNLATLRNREWAVPGQADVQGLSLTANGSLLGYSIALTKLFPSAAYVLPTNASAGTAAQRSQVVVKGSQFGSEAQVTSDAISPDGTALYFMTDGTGSQFARHWQLRVAEVATGKSRVIGTYFGVPAVIAADPSGSRLIAAIDRRFFTGGFSEVASPAMIAIPSGQISFYKKANWPSVQPFYAW